MKSILLLTSLFTSLAFADTVAIKGMTCGACAKELQVVVCENKEMSQWFETCKAKTTNPKNEMGEISYTLKKDVTLDAAKKSQIEKAITGTGRSIVKIETH